MKYLIFIPLLAFSFACSTETAVTGLQGTEVRYQAGNTTLNGYLVYDADKQGKRPGVLVVHEWWGHNDYIRYRADLLADMGYTALAIDMYGDGKSTDHPQTARQFMQDVINNTEVAEARFDAALQLLRTHSTIDGDKIAAIGYCFGGAVVLNMARRGKPLTGVASFHGSLATKHPAQKDTVHAHILVLHGEDDSFIPQQHIRDFHSEMRNANVNFSFISYPNAQHGFTNPGATALGQRHNIPIAYQAEADQRSWEALHHFLNDIFVR